MAEWRRRLPVGAEVQESGVHFRVWAPHSGSVVAVCTLPGGESEVALEPEGNGYFSAFAPDAGAGTKYRFRLDGGDELYPDPASRFQPEGPDGPSEVIDPDRYDWSDGGWRGVRLGGQVIYELHVGTFTKEGTWQAAARELPELKHLGVTTLEVLPVADFPGEFGWGYDGVNLFAPTRLYGTPDDFRRFVDLAHNLGLGVILDVVYNHLGPEHGYLKPFAPEYFSKKYKTEWGEAFNFDGKLSGPVREFFLASTTSWIGEYHLDGLRLDATQSMFDASKQHILSEISQRVREAAQGRSTLVIGENEPQEVRLLREIDAGGCGFDALWNEDFHRTAMVALTGGKEAYYQDYGGTPQEFISASKRGFLYQGQWSRQQQQRRGTPTIGLSPNRFVAYLQNHDQVANAARGLRLHCQTSPALLRAMTAFLLLGPQTPMLFQGQEFAASTPFHYFADHADELSELVRKGRAEFLTQFRNLATPEMQATLPDPGDRRTFEASRLDFSDREKNHEIYLLHRDLIRLRREDPVFSKQGAFGLDGAVLGRDAFVLRFFEPEGNDRLLLLNLGKDLHLDPAPEPLLAPPAGMLWLTSWSSEDPKYGGEGQIEIEDENNWYLPRATAIVRIPRDAPAET